MKRNIYILAFIAILLFGCNNKEISYPPEPQIDFTKMYVIDSVDALGNKIKIYDIFFNIIDGDYDFGLKDSDTTGIFSHDSTYYNNLFITYYVYSNGGWRILDVPSSNYRIPYVPPQGLNKYFKAEIDVKIALQIGFLSVDSLKFKFYVVDKALHKSNEQETPAVSLDFSGIIVDTVNIISP